MVWTFTGAVVIWYFGTRHWVGGRHPGGAEPKTARRVILCKGRATAGSKATCCGEPPWWDGEPESAMG